MYMYIYILHAVTITETEFDAKNGNGRTKCWNDYLDNLYRFLCPSGSPLS